MDTSETYINMCRQAKELQEMWEPKEGDWFVHEMRIETLGSLHATLFSNDIIECDYDAEDWQKIHVNDCVWLPRIDQLIELLSKEFPYWTQFNGFELFRRIADGYDRDKRSGTSEQRILELLTGEKYNKYWNGVDWA